MEIFKVTAVILAVFLHQGNGRAITSTRNIEGMLDLTEEGLNTVLNETSENSTEREENPADVLRLSEPDSSSHEVFSSENTIQPKEASSVLRLKRSHVGPCYNGTYQTVTLATGEVAAFPICKKLSLTGCASAIVSHQQRLCVASSVEQVRIRSDDGTNDTRTFPRSCSCGT